MAPVEAKPELSTGITTTSVFVTGNHGVKSITVESGDSSITSPPPKSLLILTPVNEGIYPVLLFLHGFALYNHFYSQLLSHIASHGYISVAPQVIGLGYLVSRSFLTVRVRMSGSFVVELYNPMQFMTASGTDDINSAAAVTDWFSQGLQSVLPENVEADLSKLALVGHSRGGKAAFALALGSYAKTSLRYSVLVGIDPVAGVCKCYQFPPAILTYQEESFNLGMPAIVVGTGLGDKKANAFSPCACAPKGLNHEEFFKECKPTRGHMVAADYGHMDILNDDPSGIFGCFSSISCKNGSGSRDLMRRCVGGIVVASIKAYVQHHTADLKAIVDDPSIAPTKLDPVVLNEA